MVVKIENDLSEPDYRSIANGLKNNSTQAYLIRGIHLGSPVKTIEGVKFTPLSNHEYKAESRVTASEAPFEILYFQDLESYFGKLCVGTEASNSNIRFESDHLDYILEAPDKNTFTISTETPRKIRAKTIGSDAENILKLTETTINALLDIYRTDDLPVGNIDVSIRTKLGFGKEKEMERMGPAQPKWKVERLERLPYEVAFADIGGCEKAKKEMAILSFGLNNPKEYKVTGLDYPRGMLLVGPPGTGKTLLARATARASGAGVIEANISEITDMWYGKSEKHLRSLFEAARNSAPSIILFDEVDGMTPSRLDSSEPTAKLVSVMLSEMDGLEKDKSNGVIVIGTTNNLSRIDPGFLRPGRFDKIIEVPLPDYTGRMNIYEIQCRGKLVAPSINYRELAKKSDGFSGADIKGTIRNAMDEMIYKTKIIGKGEAYIPLTTEDLLKSIAKYGQQKMSLGNNQIYC